MHKFFPVPAEGARCMHKRRSTWAYGIRPKEASLTRGRGLWLFMEISIDQLSAPI